MRLSNLSSRCSKSLSRASFTNRSNISENLAPPSAGLEPQAGPAPIYLRYRHCRRDNRPSKRSTTDPKTDTENDVKKLVVATVGASTTGLKKKNTELLKASHSTIGWILRHMQIASARVYQHRHSICACIYQVFCIVI